MEESWKSVDLLQLFRELQAWEERIEAKKRDLRLSLKARLAQEEQRHRKVLREILSKVEVPRPSLPPVRPPDLDLLAEVWEEEILSLVGYRGKGRGV